VFSLLVICCLRTLWLFFLFVSAPRCLDAAVDLQWQVNGNSIRVLDQVGDHGSGLTTTEGPLGLGRVLINRGCFGQCPFCPQKQTFVSALSMSALCQKRTSAAAVATVCTAFATSSIDEHVGKQRRGAVHFAGFAIGHGFGFGIQKLAIDHLSQHQHVVAGRVFAQDLALEPSQCLTQQG
jgi:hypothetical protein